MGEYPRSQNFCVMDEKPKGKGKESLADRLKKARKNMVSMSKLD